jgi:hypothetical protein
MLYLDDLESYQRFQKGDVVEIYRVDDETPISFAKYFGPNEEHIIFQDSEGMKVVELDTRDTPNVYSLVNGTISFTDVLVGNQAVIVYLSNDQLKQFSFPIRRATLF